MIPLPPRSTLFPTRRSSDLNFSRAGQKLFRSQPAVSAQIRQLEQEYGEKLLDRAGKRSEEHTSELQSRGHLVCRLLLEKKKTRKTRAWKHAQLQGQSPLCAR